ncbi:Serine/threonine-protein kinase SCH9 [Taenia solium]|eukprot:TsM_000876700 transcript=TsM_000876700 gene=TsM_000876700
MESKRFDVVKFISRGSYCIVYEVAYPQDGDENTRTTWALKRFYLKRSSAARCALREHDILVRLALADKQSSFIVTLLQSLRIHGDPALVLQKGSGYDLGDLISNFDYLDEKDARFYSCEIICGLEHLHSMGIVHLDIKPTNMLIADSGHLLISDFDRSYDMTKATEPPRRTDFAGTPLFKAPEIRNQIEITTKADIWSLGVLVATIMYGYAKVEDWLHTFQFTTGCLPNASAPLRQFFQACLTENPKRRLDIGGVKCLDFYRDVSWEDVVSCTMEPPYHPSEFDFSAAVENFDLDPYDPLLLNAAQSTHMPMIYGGLRDTCDKNGVRQLLVHIPNHVELAEAGLTPKRIDEIFAGFNFMNPHHLESFHGFEAKPNVNGDGNVLSYSKQAEMEGFLSPPSGTQQLKPYIFSSPT